MNEPDLFDVEITTNELREAAERLGRVARDMTELGPQSTRATVDYLVAEARQCLTVVWSNAHFLCDVQVRKGEHHE